METARREEVVAPRYPGLPYLGSLLEVPQLGREQISVELIVERPDAPGLAGLDSSADAAEDQLGNGRDPPGSSEA